KSAGVVSVAPDIATLFKRGYHAMDAGFGREAHPIAHVIDGRRDSVFGDPPLEKLQQFFLPARQPAHAASSISVCSPSAIWAASKSFMRAWRYSAVAGLLRGLGLPSVAMRRAHTASR